MKFLSQSLFLITLFLFTQNLMSQNCPADLTNDDTSVQFNDGHAQGWEGTAGVTGVSNETNGSPCALRLAQDGSGGEYNRWTIPIDMQSSANNIEVGDLIEFSIDGYGLTGDARVIVRSDADYSNLLDKQFFQNGGWETFSSSFIVPAGATKLLIFLYVNSKKAAAGVSLYDNLVFRDVNSSGDTDNGGGGNSYWTQNGSNVHYTDGNVGIGTTAPDEALTVKGRIHTEEVIVNLDVPAPDYVFYDDYNLISLEEIQKHIDEFGHLPNIPSAKEMETNGVKLKEMNMKLLEKIEELTLYILQQEERIKKLEKN